jgi:hypothetical protein
VIAERFNGQWTSLYWIRGKARTYYEPFLGKVGSNFDSSFAMNSVRSANSTDDEQHS